MSPGPRTEPEPAGLDVLFVGGTAADVGEWEASAAGLVRAGHRVRWVRAAGVGSNAALGGELMPVPASSVPFRRVAPSVTDTALEQVVFGELRHRPPDVVQQCGFGPGSSALVAWHGARLGVPVVAAVNLARTLCHRGSLIDAAARPCTIWDDPARCLECCLAPSVDGLTPIQARLARLLRWLGGLGPFPSLVGFENRLDLVVSGLLAATTVLVDDEAAAAALHTLGVPLSKTVVLPPGDRDAVGLARIYRRCAERVAP